MSKLKLFWNKFWSIFDIMNWITKTLKRENNKSTSKRDSSAKYRSSEISSGLVRVSHLIKSNTNETQVVKIGDKYFKVRELG
ncbi:hypothetical protein [Salegentibacter maritimus]|uniref:hypothetical protein n=1 Tax=Salegentibacter maritimus TaxID=2794347 RepID=UPI0018E45A64|nr:hypothetical protein [Salegentibacter maritimus]MBI6118367.1 hypothetical protein [Salegentibacter maritimus]